MRLWPARRIRELRAKSRAHKRRVTGHRCGAKTRSGALCKSAPVTGRRRCRMHGDADGSGAPRGSKNGNYKHGRYTAEVAAPSSHWKLSECGKEIE
jgi:hypothetical protein